MFIAYWTWSFYHAVLGEKPAVLTIPVDLIIKEAIKIPIASRTIHPEGSIPNGIAMIIPITTENSEKHVDSVMVCLKERPKSIAETFGMTNNADTSNTPTNCIDVTAATPDIPISK